MTNRPHRFSKTLARPVPSTAPLPSASLSVAQLAYQANGWLVDCEIRQHSPATTATRRMMLDKLLWFLKENDLPCCGLAELRGFFSYLMSGHTGMGGRWGNPHMTRPVRPRTVETYHGHLRTFFAWVVGQGSLDQSPMARISAPICRADQIQPFTPAQVEAVLSAARTTQQPRRDEAIIMLLLDTGIRASELCGLTHGDLDLTERRITVLGKGNKKRSVYFGQRATKLLWTHLGGKEIEGEVPLFPSESTAGKGGHLSRYGLRDMIERLKGISGVTGVRCSAHTFRHTFAVSFLRAGGQVYALKEILGHTDIKQTLKYVALADADLKGQRRFSPGDQLAGTGPAGKPRTWNKVAGAKRATEPKRSMALSEEATSHPEKITHSKLTEWQVREIKARLASPGGLSKTALRIEIAAEYGISAATVKEVDLGYSWRHIE